MAKADIQRAMQMLDPDTCAEVYELPNLMARESFHLEQERVASFDELNLPPSLAGFCNLNSGMIVVAGFMGSGRSTTVAALVEQINQTRPLHIVMIENPIEFVYGLGPKGIAFFRAVDGNLSDAFRFFIFDVAIGFCAYPIY